jgi:hypothetical protein
MKMILTIIVIIVLCLIVGSIFRGSKPDRGKDWNVGYEGLLRISGGCLILIIFALIGFLLTFLSRH